MDLAKILNAVNRIARCINRLNKIRASIINIQQARIVLGDSPEHYAIWELTCNQVRMNSLQFLLFIPGLLFYNRGK